MSLDEANQDMLAPGHFRQWYVVVISSHERHKGATSDSGVLRSPAAMTITNATNTNATVVGRAV